MKCLRQCSFYFGANIIVFYVLTDSDVFKRYCNKQMFIAKIYFTLTLVSVMDSTLTFLLILVPVKLKFHRQIFSNMIFL